MQDAFLVEQTGKPAAVFVNENFLSCGRETAARAMPKIRMVGNTTPPENTVLEKARAGITPVIDELIDALTKPLTDEEKSPKQPVAQPPSIGFKGTLSEVNRFFYTQGWTDGLPILPPTEEAVSEMLTGTDLPRDHVVATLEPGLGKATVEKIAINAVMAGALPTYMPVLIAGVQALADPMRRFALHLISTGSWSPFWIINGPIRKELAINKGTGAFSPGIIANAAIGRAMGLIIQNTAQARKGIEDMGHLGNPERYTMVIAEDEEASPWESLHVDQGFAKDDSAVTLHYPHQFVQFWALGTTAKGILTAITADALPGAPGKTCLLINPTHARILADEGWSKADIKGYVSRFARCPAHQHFFSILPGHPKATIPLEDGELRSLFLSPDDIIVIVGGGTTGNFIGMFTGGHLGGSTFVTKKVELPQKWASVVKKYKGMVPTYLKNSSLRDLCS